MTQTNAWRRRWGAPFTLTALTLALSIVSDQIASAATRPSLGGSCTRSGTTGAAKDGSVLICGRNSRKKLVWQLPTLGSKLRPVPLGQALEAGPIGHRFRVRVTNVERNVTPEQISEYAVAADPGTTFVRVTVEVVFAGPALASNTEHVWGVVDAAGRTYASTDGCGGGYGTNFDVTALVPKGAPLSGTHCLTVPEGAVAGLRLRVEGYGDRPDTYFALG